MAATEEKSPGPGVDAQGTPVVDPTKNVLDLVDAAVTRLNDLATERDKLLVAREQRHDDLFAAESKHVRELMAMTTRYEDLLRKAETDRINAIRAVDVGAVAEASRVAAAQAITLANQVALSAETLRTQVAQVAAAATASLGTALQPLQEAISDLRKAQYEQQGQKSAHIETRGTNQWGVGIAITVVGLMLSLVGITVAILVATHK